MPLRTLGTCGLTGSARWPCALPAVGLAGRLAVALTAALAAPASAARRAAGLAAAPGPEGSVIGGARTCFGQLGDGRPRANSPSRMLPTRCRYTTVMSVEDFIVRADHDRPVDAWGYNLFGQTGDCTTKPCGCGRSGHTLSGRR